jgi:putative toxin-antitoxin system antitoxin component (TIGR02293 family)
MSSDKNPKYQLGPSEGRDMRAEEPYIAWDLSKSAAMVGAGLASEILQVIQNRLGLSNHELSELLMVSPRTIDRRKKEEVLPIDESERSLRIARLTDLAADVLGGMETASEWFHKPNFALGNKKPIDLMKTEPGARLVERTLNGIRHGLPV